MNPGSSKTRLRISAANSPDNSVRDIPISPRLIPL
jgi:hypothetical protein